MTKFIEVTLTDNKKVTLNTNNILKIEELKKDHRCKTKILFSKRTEIENILVREDYICINEMLDTIESHFVDEEDKKQEELRATLSSYLSQKKTDRSN